MKAHNRRMLSDQSARYAHTLVADASHYDRYWPKADINCKRNSNYIIR